MAVFRGFLSATNRNSHGAAATASPSSLTGRSTIRRPDEIKWQELLSHFRNVQMKHERARRTQPSESDGDGIGVANAPLPLAAALRTGGGVPTRRKGLSDTPPLTGGSRSFGGKIGSIASKAPSVSGSRALSPQSQTTNSSRQQRRTPGVAKR